MENIQFDIFKEKCHAGCRKEKSTKQIKSSMKRNKSESKQHIFTGVYIKPVSQKGIDSDIVVSYQNQIVYRSCIAEILSFFLLGPFILKVLVWVF